jgi:hypothetical protein
MRMKAKENMKAKEGRDEKAFLSDDSLLVGSVGTPFTDARSMDLDGR